MNPLEQMLYNRVTSLYRQIFKKPEELDLEMRKLDQAIKNIKDKTDQDQAEQDALAGQAEAEAEDKAKFEDQVAAEAEAEARFQSEGGPNG
jgi:hypothetical protein